MVLDSVPIVHHLLFGVCEHIGKLVKAVEVDNMAMEYWLLPPHHNDVLELVVEIELVPASAALGIPQYLS